MTYEVHHFTLCDGLINCWKTIDASGAQTPEQYETRAEAEAAIDEFLADIANDIAAGECEPDHGYMTVTNSASLRARRSDPPRLAFR